MLWGLAALFMIGVLLAVSGRSFRNWLSERSTVCEYTEGEDWTEDGGNDDYWTD